MSMTRNESKRNETKRNELYKLGHIKNRILNLKKKDETKYEVCE